MNTNNYNAGVPPTNAQAKVPLSTRIESQIPGTQAHREREYLEHENQASLRGTHHSGIPPTSTGMNTTQAPVYSNDVAPTGGMMGGRAHGGMAPGATAPVNHHGTTMSERVDELHGGRRGHAAAGVAGAPMTGAHTSTTETKPHMGDKVMGGVEAAIGRATNNPAMEQSGWERKTFGDPKHRQDGLGHGGIQPTTHQQGYGPGGQPAQQGFTNPQAGYIAPTHPPAGY